MKVFDGHGLSAVEWQPGDDTIRLLVTGLDTVTARYAIGADGMWSPLRKALGAADEPGYLGEWHAFRQYFTGVNGPAATQMWVWFEEDLLPGYVWSFPLPDGRLNVGYGVQRGSKRAPEPLGKRMRQLWPEILARPHIRDVLGHDAVPEAPHKAWPIPARDTPLTAAGGRALFVGDAARATDPMTGEGIGQALDTGVHAAAAILAAGAMRPRSAAVHYQREVQRTLAVDNRLAEALSRALRHRKGARGAIRLSGLTPWTRRSFARWLFEDYPRALAATPSRWRRGALSSPGAFFDSAERGR
ncbi:MAG: FAD-dependent monooxygenase [Actinobacteria bacterium]|nr:FAD-dependent monooxygenase [Actinomycetota bacterium]